MQEVEPNVSTPSRFLTSTFFLAKHLAVIAKDIVTHPNKPSGTLDTKIPIPNNTHGKIGYSTTSHPSKKKSIPSPIAIKKIRTTNISSSYFKGLFYVFSADERLAIYPRVVASPILTTTPFP